MKMCGGSQIMLLVVSLASASWTVSMVFSTFITGNYGRSADNKNNNYHTNGSSSTDLPLHETNGSLGGSLKSFISGSVGGIMSVIVGHPLDLIKVRMQTALPTGHHDESASMMRTFRESGVGGMYRGVSAPLLAAAFVFAVSFWAYDVGQRIVRHVTRHADLSLFELCLAGGMSAVPSALLVAPSERIKVLMQTDSRHTTMFGCGLAILREGGIRSLMRGTLLTLCRDVPGYMAWFGTYEYVKYLFLIHLGRVNAAQLPPLAVLVAGGLAGMAYWIAAMPVDVLKSRLQAAPEGTYSGVLDVFRQAIRAEGPAALFKGIAPALLRAFPASAACFYGVEVSKQFLDYLEGLLYS